MGQGPYPRATENSAVDWPELKKRLDIVRADGIAVSDEEFEVGLASLAIALPTPVDRSLRAINISLPVSRATPDFRATAGRLLREVAAEIGSIEGSSAE
ncbi:IclR family transcriptional regulator C-terminal domain-containing protein [Mycolicibacterium sp. CBMA 334]|uniref:IclR family transcriptional regulator domain-containing protein n=1 Tax=Mycolicibacterium sp. CBMA 334 TaxID=2606607 RepID=UPI0012DCDA3E|nr:hypothetical protein [Mycolicibacterium sp. CBMA 334]